MTSRCFSGTQGLCDSRKSREFRAYSIFYSIEGMGPAGVLTNFVAQSVGDQAIGPKS